jgi:murein tripeptide amidase MpaA
MKVSHTYDHFYNYTNLTQILEGYATDYPNLVKLSALAQSSEGRNVWAIEVTNIAAGDYADKPAFLVTGNIHAGEVTGSMVALFALDYLLTNYGTDADVTRLLDRCTFYFIPRITPDGSEHYLTTPDVLRSVNKFFPYSEPAPGMNAKDIDGDGVIRKIRLKTPSGVWKASKLDPRLLSRRQPDDIEGDFYNVYTEGELLEPDDILKDAPPHFGNDFNRNFPFSWAPHTTQRGAGEFALIHPETYAVAHFLSGHKNIGIAVNMHTMGGQYLYPPSSKARKDSFKEDMARYQALGRIGAEESGYPVVNIHDEYLPVGTTGGLSGSLEDFSYFNLGMISFTIECWDIHARAGVEMKYPPDETIPDDVQETNGLKYLQWVDENLGGKGMKPWTKFDHPQLGEVEIGGLDYKTVVQNCPEGFLRQEQEKHTRFFLRAARALPNLSFRDVKVSVVADDIYRVEATILNSAFLPSYVTREAVEAGRSRDLIVSLDGADAYIQGKAKQTIGQLEGFSSITATNTVMGPSNLINDPCEKKVDWIIKAKPGAVLTLSCASPQTGRITAAVTL